MFSFKMKTVASVMHNFLTIIDDLEQIVLTQTDLANTLDQERAAISAKIETADLERHQARGIADRLTKLCGGDCPS